MPPEVRMVSPGNNPSAFPCEVHALGDETPPKPAVVTQQRIAMLSYDGVVTNDPMCGDKCVPVPMDFGGLPAWFNPPDP